MQIRWGEQPTTKRRILEVRLGNGIALAMVFPSPASDTVIFLNSNYEDSNYIPKTQV